jgi:prolyl-tRNA synthetase
MHSVHATQQDATDTTNELIELYDDFIKYYLCIPTLMGEKTEGERFAGANNTYTIEALMQDGQALQCATSHNLGQNFSKTFDIKFQNRENQYELVYQASAGLSTRIIGALIMTHADDKGLVLPTGVAPIQIALLPIAANKDPNVLSLTDKVYNALRIKYRIEVDNSNNGMGFKIANQEVQGTPIILVIGPREASENTLVLIRRDTGAKITLPIDKDILKAIEAQLHQYQVDIYQKALTRLKKSIVEVKTLEELIKVVDSKKIAKAP